MRIAILTFHRAYNCGAQLQAWALKTVLERMGHTVIFPDLNNIGEFKRFRRFATKKNGMLYCLAFLRWMWIAFRSLVTIDRLRKYYEVFRDTNLMHRSVDINDWRSFCDFVVVGSDQVWCPDIAKEWSGLFLGRLISHDIPCIGYAVSSGDRKLDDGDLKRIVDALPRFKALAVREDSLADQLESRVHLKFPVVLDPTLLLDAVDYETIESKQGHLSRPYLYVYGPLDGRMLVRARWLCKKLHLKLLMTPPYANSRYDMPCGVTYDIAADLFLSYIRNAAYVFCDSFHATVFSILYKKPFLNLHEECAGVESRPMHLLRSLGISERQVDVSISNDDLLMRMRKPIPEDLGSRLKHLREESLLFLRHAIGGEGNGR